MQCKVGLRKLGSSLNSSWVSSSLRLACTHQRLGRLLNYQAASSLLRDPPSPPSSLPRSSLSLSCKSDFFSIIVIQKCDSISAHQLSGTRYLLTKLNITWSRGWHDLKRWCLKWGFGVSKCDFGSQNGATRKATPKELGLDAQLTPEPVISCHSRYLSKVEVQPWRKVEWPLFILSDQPITRPTDHTAARHIWSAQYWVVIIHLTFIRPAHFFVWFPTIKPNWLKSEEEGLGYPEGFLWRFDMRELEAGGF